MFDSPKLSILSLLRDAYQLAHAQSDDPLTKVGAILVNSNGIVIGQGANRLPDKVTSNPNRVERPEKYDYLIHAEQNAIANAARQGNATAQSTLYCPWAACTACARLIIQAGVKKVVTHKALMIQTHSKWRPEIDKSRQMFQEADIEFIEFDEVIGNVEHIFNGTIWAP